MNSVVLVDTNLLVLFVVGAASEAILAKRKALQDFDSDDLARVNDIVGRFDGILLLPHVLAETSSFVRQIKQPDRDVISAQFAALVQTRAELLTPSLNGVARPEFAAIGLTDSIVLHVCVEEPLDQRPALLTADTDLANRVASLGGRAIDYRSLFMAD